MFIKLKLAQDLSKMYDNAPDGDKVAMIHLFGIRYAKEINENSITATAIIENTKLSNGESIPSSYVTEINKGIRLAKYVIEKDTLAPKPLPTVSPLKIGQLVQGEFRRMLEAGVGNDDEFELQIQLMQDLDYSKEMFHLQYSVLQEERLFCSGQYRYYATPLWIRGKKYYLCSQWGEINRPFLERWILESRQ
jgi:5-methylcytosine-specific restriction protein B